MQFFFQQDTNLFFIIVLFRSEYSMHVVLMIHSFFYVAKWTKIWKNYAMNLMNLCVHMVPFGF